MIKFNIDYSTARRLVGWAYEDSTLLPVADLSVGDGARLRPIPMISRPDVAASFGLRDDKVGFDLIVPDCFDGSVADYHLVADGKQLFSYAKGLEALATVAQGDGGCAAVAGESGCAVNYAAGRHVVFIHNGNDSLATRLKLLRQPRYSTFFPALVAGCHFSDMTLEALDTGKAAIVPRRDDMILVCPSELSEHLYRVSPTLYGSERLVTLYDNGSLQSRFGIHELQLNNFIQAKAPPPRFDDPWLDTLSAVWSAVETYADVLFARMDRTYFMARDEASMDPLIAEYVRRHIQGTRTEAVIKITRGASAMTLVNYCAYVRLFDHLGTDGCWRAAMRRGLTHSLVELQ